MNFKYYDLLSNLTIGMVMFYSFWKFFLPDYEISEWIVFPAGYVVGYMLDAFSSFIEPLLFMAINGKPSDRLLTIVPDQKWSGIKKVKLFFPERVVNQLKTDTGDAEASTDKMFDFAMQYVNSNKECRVPDFNGHYALSRVFLTTILIAVVLVELKYYYVWYSWPISLAVLFLAWNRFKERGYYYAREVLTEYYKMKNKV